MKYYEIVDEGITTDLVKRLLPREWRHYLTRAVHKEAYKKIIKLQKKIMKDQTITPHLALLKAAGVYGITSREIMAVMDKDRRHK